MWKEFVSLWNRYLFVYATFRSQVESCVHKRELRFFYLNALLCSIYGAVMCFYDEKESYSSFIDYVYLSERDASHAQQEKMRQATRQKAFSFGIVAMISLCVPYYVSYASYFCFRPSKKFVTVVKAQADLLNFRIMGGMFLLLTSVALPLILLLSLMPSEDMQYDDMLHEFGFILVIQRAILLSTVVDILNSMDPRHFPALWCLKLIFCSYLLFIPGLSGPQYKTIRALVLILNVLVLAYGLIPYLYWRAKRWYYGDAFIDDDDYIGIVNTSKVAIDHDDGGKGNGHDASNDVLGASQSNNNNSNHSRHSNNDHGNDGGIKSQDEGGHDMSNHIDPAALKAMRDDVCLRIVGTFLFVRCGTVVVMKSIQMTDDVQSCAILMLLLVFLSIVHFFNYHCLFATVDFESSKLMLTASLLRRIETQELQNVLSKILPVDIVTKLLSNPRMLDEIGPIVTSDFILYNLKTAFEEYDDSHNDTSSHRNTLEDPLRRSYEGHVSSSLAESSQRDDYSSENQEQKHTDYHALVDRGIGYGARAPVIAGSMDSSSGSDNDDDDDNHPLSSGEQLRYHTDQHDRTTTTNLNGQMNGYTSLHGHSYTHRTHDGVTHDHTSDDNLGTSNYMGSTSL